MKKNILMILIGIIIGGIVFGSIVYAYSYTAKQVSFTPNDKNWKVTTVDDAINSLYIKSGTTIKELNSQISILTSENSGLKSQLDVFDSASCISGSFNGNTQMTTSDGYVIESEFVPSRFFMYLDMGSKEVFFYDKNYDININGITLSTSNTGSFASYNNLFTLKNNSLIAHNFGSGGFGKTYYWMACK